MPATPPGPGYTRASLYRGFPSSVHAAMVAAGLDEEQATRFGVEFQNIMHAEFVAGNNFGWHGMFWFHLSRYKRWWRERWPNGAHKHYMCTTIYAQHAKRWRRRYIPK